MKKAVDLVMFDLDGTLADTGHDLADAVNFTRAHFDLPPLPDQAVLCARRPRRRASAQTSVAGGEPESFPRMMRVFFDHYENHLLDRTVLYPGARGNFANIFVTSGASWSATKSTGSRWQWCGD